jgi:hypothetical protein
VHFVGTIIVFICKVSSYVISPNIMRFPI